MPINIQEAYKTPNRLDQNRKSLSVATPGYIRMGYRVPWKESWGKEPDGEKELKTRFLAQGSKFNGVLEIYRWVEPFPQRLKTCQQNWFACSAGGWHQVASVSQEGTSPWRTID